MKKTVPNPQTGKKFPAAKPPDPAPAGKKETACQGQNPQTKNAGVNRKNTGEKNGTSHNYNYNYNYLFKNNKKNYNYNYDNYSEKVEQSDGLILLAQLPPPCRRIVEAWNRLGLKQFAGLYPVILYSVNNLLEQYGEETVVAVVQSIAQSPFLLGRNNTPNHWCATFTWILKQNNFEKVLQGTYHKHLTGGCRCAENSGENFATGPSIAEGIKDECSRTEKNPRRSGPGKTVTQPAEEQKARSRKEARPSNVLLENMARTLGVKY